MDLKHYFQKLRDLEKSILSAHVHVVSLPTPDGGKEGVITEVARRLACQLIVEGRARLASQEEAGRHEAEAARQRASYLEEEIAGKIQVQVVTESDKRSIKTVKPVRE